jgi:hypothetical protein
LAQWSSCWRKDCGSGVGTKAVGWDNLVYGVLLVVFIIFLPKGILGSIAEQLKARRGLAKQAPISLPLPALPGERSEASRSEVSG